MDEQGQGKTSEAGTEEKTLAGHCLALPDNREVWLADEKTDDGANRVMFTNKNGEETRIALSDEAIEALIELWRSRASHGRVWRCKIDRTNDSPPAPDA